MTDSRPSMPLRLAAAALVLAIASPAWTQTSLPDKTTVVGTTQGLFVALPSDNGALNTDPVGLQVATPADFGIASFLNSPSVAWIDYSNVVMVSSSTKLFRVVLTPAGQLASIQQLATGTFTDVEYSAGLDTLFVLDAVNGVVHALFDPRTASGAALTVWNDKLTPGDAIDMAINTQRWPFSLIVLAQSGFLRVRENNLGPLVEWINPGQWTAIDLGPVGGGLYVTDAGYHFGRAAINLLNDTVSGVFPGNACNVLPIVGLEPFYTPHDLVSDARGWTAGLPGVVVVANQVNPISCLNAGSGPNHVGRFPVAWPLGNPQGEVQLLTPAPSSGISGGQGDLDFVRAEPRGFTHQAWPQWTYDHVYRPVMDPTALANGLDLSLLDAPPSQLAALELHVLLPGQPVPIETLTPFNADALTLFLTSPSGEIPLTVPLPAGPLFTGTRAVVRWHVADPSTIPGEPSFVATQRLIYHHGAP